MFILSGDKIMNKKTEKGDLGKVLSCIRLALCNESIADMAETIGISPTYLNSIECNIRPCTFKILESIFVNYVERKEIKFLNMDIFNPQNVFNCAWNCGLSSTLGIPLTSSQVFKVLQSRVKKQKPASENDKALWLQKICNNPEEYFSIPTKYFIDEQFIEDVQQAVRFTLIQNINNSPEELEYIEEKINTLFNNIAKKTIKSIAKCGQSLENMKTIASGISLVKIKNKKLKCD